MVPIVKDAIFVPMKQKQIIIYIPLFWHQDLEANYMKRLFLTA